jgi:hypothetical protein
VYIYTYQRINEKGLGHYSLVKLYFLELFSQFHSKQPQTCMYSNHAFVQPACTWWALMPLPWMHKLVAAVYDTTTSGTYDVHSEFTPTVYFSNPSNHWQLQFHCLLLMSLSMSPYSSTWLGRVPSFFYNHTVIYPSVVSVTLLVYVHLIILHFFVITMWGYLWKN